MKIQKKYILVTMEPMNNDLIPLGMKGRDIVDMTRPGSHDKLYRKLRDAPAYKFSDVAEKKSLPETKKIEAFKPVAEPPLTIEAIITGTPLSQTQYRLIRELTVPCRIAIKNEGSKVMENATIEVTLPRNILKEQLPHSVVGENIIVNFAVKKLYPNQPHQTEEFNLVLKNTNVDVINKPILIKVYSDNGLSETSKIIKEFVKFDESLMNMNPKPLTEDMFLPLNHF